MNKRSRILKSYFFYLLSALGISLTIKAHIGVGSYSAMNSAISQVTTIQVGTITTFANLVFLVLYMALTRFSRKKQYVVQLISVLTFGMFINFFTYNLLAQLQPSGYALRLTLMITGTLIGGLSVGAITHYGAITFPIESVCVELAGRTTHSFRRLRYSVDVLAILISLFISLNWQLPLFIREGTLINLILLSYAMAASLKYLGRHQKQSRPA